MFVTNHQFAIKVTLPKTANFAAYAALSTFDTIIELPDKSVLYDDNITGYGSATYTTPVTATTDGEITFNYTPTQKGIHRITISTGTSGSYVSLGTLICLVVDPATTATLKTKLS